MSLRYLIPLLAAAAMLAGTAPAAAQSATQQEFRAQQEQGRTPRYECQRVRRCRPVVRCHPYSWAPWTCYRRRSCETVRECHPVSGPPEGYQQE